MIRRYSYTLVFEVNYTYVNTGLNRVRPLVTNRTSHLVEDIGSNTIISFTREFQSKLSRTELNICYHFSTIYVIYGLMKVLKVYFFEFLINGILRITLAQ